MKYFLNIFLCLCIFSALNCESVKEVPVRYVSLRTLNNTFPQKNIKSVPVLNYGQFAINRDIRRRPTVIENGSKNFLSVKTASIDKFYDTKEFQDLLKEFKLTVDKKRLPNIRDVVSLLGTKNSQETLNAIRDFASTSDGLDIIKNYLEYDVANDRIDVIPEPQPRTSKFYEKPEHDDKTTSSDGNSWWNKIVKWLGLSQSTKIESTKKDLEILSTIVPFTNSFDKNVKYIGNFFKPQPQTKIPINPPFKVFNSHSIKLSNHPYSIDVKTLPTIQLTEHQYNEMMKAVNLNSQKLAQINVIKQQEDFSGNHYNSPDVKRSFSTQTQPIRSSLIDLPTGSLFKANPDDIDKVSKILSEQFDDKEVVSNISDLIAKKQN